MNKRVKKVQVRAVTNMAGINWPGINPTLKDRLYTYGAIALLIATAWLVGLHIYQLINPPTMTVVLAAQPGGNKPQTTIAYQCGWSWTSPSAPAGATVGFTGTCEYDYTLGFAQYYFIVYIYDPYGPPTNPAPYGTVTLTEGNAGTKTFSVTLNYVYYNGQYAWYWNSGEVSYYNPWIGTGVISASISGYWTPNAPYTYTGCAYAGPTFGINFGSPGCSSLSVS